MTPPCVRTCLSVQSTESHDQQSNILSYRHFLTIVPALITAGSAQERPGGSCPIAAGGRFPSLLGAKRGGAGGGKEMTLMGRKGRGGGGGGEAVVPGADRVSVNTSFYKLLMHGGCHNTQPFITAPTKTNKPLLLFRSFFFFSSSFHNRSDSGPRRPTSSGGEKLLPARRLNVGSESKQLEGERKPQWDPRRVPTGTGSALSPPGSSRQ